MSTDPTPTEAVRAALLARDEHAFVRALGRFGDTAEAEGVAVAELSHLDAVTRQWWAQPADCDGDCGHDHTLVTSGVQGFLDGIRERR